MHRIIECFDSRHHDITVTQLRAVVEQCFLKERGQGQMIPELLDMFINPVLALFMPCPIVT